MWTIKGQINIINKIEEMINSVERQLTLSVPTEVLERIKPTLDKVARKDIEIKLMVSQRGNPDAAIPAVSDAIKLTRKDDIPAILVVVDRKQALISSGCTSNYKGPWISVWTNEPSFVELVLIFFASH
jgi:sugar-specific transcriptional regulator TrmB